MKYMQIMPFLSSFNLGHVCSMQCDCSSFSGVWKARRWRQLVLTSNSLAIPCSSHLLASLFRSQRPRGNSCCSKEAAVPTPTRSSYPLAHLPQSKLFKLRRLRFLLPVITFPSLLSKSSSQQIELWQTSPHHPQCTSSQKPR